MAIAIIACVMLLVGGASLAAEGTPVIMDSAHLRALCIVGSALGAVISIGLLPTDTTSMPQYALKFGVSATTGILTSPLVVRYLEIQPDSDIVLGVSGLIAILSTVTLHKVLPFYERWLDSKLNHLTK
jgi:hypothetical protein